jgi:hypothetical protein
MGKRCSSSTINCGSTSISRVSTRIEDMESHTDPRKGDSGNPHHERRRRQDKKKKRKDKPKAIKEMLVEKKRRT